MNDEEGLKDLEKVLNTQPLKLTELVSKLRSNGRDAESNFLAVIF